MILGVLLLALITQCVCEDGCQEGWEKFEDHCYVFRKVPSNWTNALVACQFEGSSLVQLDNPGKIEWVTLKAKQSPEASFWVAGSDQVTEGEWKWIASMKSIPLGNEWASNQPDNWKGNENCIELARLWLYKFNDLNCDYINTGYICERDVGR